MPVCVCVRACVRARAFHSGAPAPHKHFFVVELTMLIYFNDCVQLMRDTCVGIVALLK